MIRNKKSSIIAIILMLAVALSITNISIVGAHDPPWEITSYPYLVISPSPVGVHQTVAVLMWIDEPLPGAAIENDIRRHDYTLTITKPDGTTESQYWDVVLDPTNIQYYEFTPDQIGTYTVKFDYAGQVFTWDEPIMGWYGPEPNPWTNDVILSASRTKTLTVQEDPVQPPILMFPYPTEYWTRPIEGQNWNWHLLGSNWLGAPYIVEAGEIYPQNGFHQPVGPAPNTAHVMWTKPIQYGGIVGGNRTTVPGEAFYTGNSYNERWSNPIIMYGTMFYEEPWGNSGYGGDYVAVDLRTGKELWRIDPAATGERLVPKFGYLYPLDDPNQHGVLPNGALVAVTGGGWSGLPETWRIYDPRTGVLTDQEVINIPGGTAVAGPRGEYLKIALTNVGDYDNPKYQLMQWNSSKVIGLGLGHAMENWYSGTADASLPSAYDWNISLALPPGEWMLANQFWQTCTMTDCNNVMLLVQGNSDYHPFDTSATGAWGGGAWENITAVSLKTQTRGQILWTKQYSPPEGNSRYLTTWDPNEGIFIMRDRHLMNIIAYSLADGEKLWGPVSLLDDDFATDLGYHDSSAETCAYGKVFVAGYSGLVKAFDAKTGDLLWTYGNGGEGNSTFVGGVGPFGRTPLFVNVVADGKIFLSSVQHSPNSPLYMNYKFRALNATDGTELWTLGHYGTLMYSSTVTVADGYLSFLNNYDSQIYTIGKGPSKTTVEAPLTAVPLGSRIVIRGTVTDISAGTKQDEQAARFPNGVPAVSDESMSKWMEYVYQQKPRPDNVEGVKVFLKILDPNGDWYSATVTADENAVFSHMWSPSIVGEYHVTAMFEGSESYYASQSTTTFGVSPAPDTGYQGPSVDDIAAETAQRTINMLPPYPDVPTQEQVADDAARRTIAMLPAYPTTEMPAYLTIDLVILILVAVGVVIGLIAFMALRKQQ